MGNALCVVCEREPEEPFPFVFAEFGTVCAGECVETLREFALSELAFDPDSRPLLELTLLSENPFDRLAATRAIAVQDAVEAAPYN